MATLGDDCVDRTNLFVVPTTCIYLKHRFPCSGNVTNWCVHFHLGAQSPHQCRLKIFREDDDNYIFVAESDLETIVEGYNSFTTDIDVFVDDYIGFYFNGTYDGIHIDQPSGEDNFAYHTVEEDVNTTTPKTEWTYENFPAVSLRVTYDPDEIYVDLSGDDSNDGKTWSTSKKTIKAGIESVGAGGLLHIGFGDYSSQDPITLDKTIVLQCETYGTGGGTGTVVLPPTA